MILLSYHLQILLVIMKYFTQMDTSKNPLPSLVEDTEQYYLIAGRLAKDRAKGVAFRVHTTLPLDSS